MPRFSESKLLGARARPGHRQSGVTFQAGASSGRGFGCPDYWGANRLAPERALDVMPWGCSGRAYLGGATAARCEGREASGRGGWVEALMLSCTG